MLQRILVPLDGSALSEGILGPVRRLLGSQLHREATLVQVVDDRLDPFHPGRHERELQEARTYLQRVRERLVDDGYKAACRVLFGDPAAAIVQHAAGERFDLVAMATHGRTGIRRWMRGSVAERVLRHCDVPLLLANPAGVDPAGGEGPEPSGFLERVIVPLDGSELAARALPLATEVARTTRAEVLLLHVDEGPGLTPEGDARRTERLRASFEGHRRALTAEGIRVGIGIDRGDPAERIVSAATGIHADLVVMTSHGRSGRSRWWFGSVAENVVRHLGCPLLVQRVGPG